MILIMETISITNHLMVLLIMVITVQQHYINNNTKNNKNANINNIDLKLKTQKNYRKNVSSVATIIFHRDPLQNCHTHIQFTE